MKLKKEKDKLCNLDELFDDSDDDSIQQKLAEQMELIEKLKKQ